MMSPIVKTFTKSFPEVVHGMFSVAPHSPVLLQYEVGQLSFFLVLVPCLFNFSNKFDWETELNRL